MRNFGSRHMAKAGLFAAAAAVAVFFGGCGKTSNNLGGATDWYNDSVYGSGTYGEGSYVGGGTAYWDGYGINGGRSMGGTASGGANGRNAGSVGSSATNGADGYGASSLQGTTATALD